MRNFIFKKQLINAYEWSIQFRRNALFELRVLINRSFHRISIMTCRRTVQYILRNHLSVARFGDGELDRIFDWGGPKSRFQDDNQMLSERLKEILVNSEENQRLLVCLPGALMSTYGFNKGGTHFWKYYGIQNGRQKILADWIENNSEKKIYGNSQFTRPYIDLKKDLNANKLFPLIIQIWDNRKVLIVEGWATRFGVNNDLLNNSKLTRRILCPARNAFSSYEKILKKTIEVAVKFDVVLIALGQTATVLAADLAKKGIWAIDIGHLDIEYEWYIRRTDKKQLIPDKFVNEVPGGDQVSECNDERYLSEIICEID